MEITSPHLLATAKLLLAALLGGLIGFERETHGQSAGFRTMLLVGLGACLMMMLSVHLQDMFAHLSSDSSVRLDPGRIASYAIASMGFLGGGAILKGKGSVRGLTTAAGLWLVTGVGLCVGAGLYLPALVTTGISLVVLYNFGRFKHFLPRHEFTLLTVTCCCDNKPLKQIKDILAEHEHVQILFTNFHQNLVSRQTTYSLRLSTRHNTPWGKIVSRLQELSGVEEVAWTEAEVP